MYFSYLPENICIAMISHKISIWNQFLSFGILILEAKRMIKGRGGIMGLRVWWGMREVLDRLVSRVFISFRLIFC